MRTHFGNTLQAVYSPEKGGGAEPPLLDSASDDLLERCRKAYQPQRLDVLYEALKICERLDAPVPDWCVDAMMDVLQRAVIGKLSGRPGNSSSPLGRALKERAYWERWNAVIDAKAGLPPAETDGSDLPHKDKKPYVVTNADEKDVPWSKVYEAAQARLEGTPWYAAPDTIKKSYQRIENCLKNKSLPYEPPFFASDETLIELGIAE